MTSEKATKPAVEPEHTDLVFTGAETKYFLTDPSNIHRRIQVTWTASRNKTPGRYDDIEYKVFISTDNTTQNYETFSLWTLGLQALGHKVTIHKVGPPSAGATIFLFEDVEMKSPILPGDDIHSPKWGPKPEGIAMIRFKDYYCVLTVTAKGRGRPGKTRWIDGEGLDESLRWSTGHSNVPPGGTLEN